jgi:prepilin-type N-terminal cleavage/methylation domain-containing protein
MRTLLAGKRSSSAPRNSGVTLVEMIIVMAIIAMIAGISYPAVSAGLESIHLSTAADSVAAFINSAVNRSERRQEVVELLVFLKENTMVMHASEEGFERRLELPDGISIEAVLPSVEAEDHDAPRRFILLPGGTAPRAAIQLVNRKRARRIVRVDPMTGVPRIETPVEEK